MISHKNPAILESSTNLTTQIYIIAAHLLKEKDFGEFKPLARCPS